MKPSFQGFLTRYCKELTSTDTTSLKKLFLLADSEYPRACEPLLLLALCQGREGYLLKQAQSSRILPRYQAFLNSWQNSGKSLEEYLDELADRDRFKRPFIAWQAETVRLETDREMLRHVAESLLELLRSRHMSRAEACRITKVNKGNFYAFLKGNTSKLSRKTAIRIYRQIEESSA